MKIKYVVLVSDFLEKVYRDENLQKLCTKWTPEELLQVVYVKSIQFENNTIFKLVGKIIEKYQRFELTLFVKIEHDWMLVESGHIVCSSNTRINRIARDIIKFLEESNVEFVEKDCTIQLFDENTLVRQVG